MSSLLTPHPAPRPPLLAQLKLKQGQPGAPCSTEERMSSSLTSRARPRCFVTSSSSLRFLAAWGGMVTRMRDPTARMVRCLATRSSSSLRFLGGRAAGVGAGVEDEGRAAAGTRARLHAAPAPQLQCGGSLGGQLQDALLHRVLRVQLVDQHRLLLAQPVRAPLGLRGLWGWGVRGDCQASCRAYTKLCRPSRRARPSASRRAGWRQGRAV